MSRQSRPRARRLSARPPVVLLHGLFRTHRSMHSAASWLEREGFETLNVGYASRRFPLEELARQVAQSLRGPLDGREERVHFLTHSMGGIVLRQMLALQERRELALRWKLGRVVMLAPPNQGSRLADVLGDRWLYRVAFGPAGQELRRRQGSLVPELPTPPKCGVVAGTRSVGGYRLFLRGRDGRELPNDGTVAVEETSLDETPRVEVGAGHTFIMNHRAALEAAVDFFRRGGFSAR